MCRHGQRQRSGHLPVLPEHRGRDAHRFRQAVTFGCAKALLDNLPINPCFLNWRLFQQVPVERNQYTAPGTEIKRKHIAGAHMAPTG